MLLALLLEDCAGAGLGLGLGADDADDVDFDTDGAINVGADC